MTQNGKVRVVFTHPRDSRSMEVDVGPALTGQGAIDGLAKSNFIDAPSGQKRYALALARTGAQLPLSQALPAGGVQEGDTVTVTETSAGAMSLASLANPSSVGRRALPLVAVACDEYLQPIQCEVAPEMTGSEVLLRLRQVGFLASPAPGERYSVVLTKLMPLHESLENLGVATGDVLRVVKHASRED